MNDTAIVYRKVQKMFSALGFDKSHYYFTFYPFGIQFTNEDFNFMNPASKSAEETSEDYNDKWVFAEMANTLNGTGWELTNQEKIYDEDRYNWLINNAQLIDTELSDDDKTVYSEAKAILYKDSDSFIWGPSSV